MVTRASIRVGMAVRLTDGRAGQVWALGSEHNTVWVTVAGQRSVLACHSAARGHDPDACKTVAHVARRGDL